MEIIPIRSEVIKQNDDLILAICNSLDSAGATLQDGDLLAVSSKVVSYAENRLVEYSNDEEYEELVKAEADIFVEGEIMDLTQKYGIWIGSSGIDKSNAPKGMVILWPADPQKSADELRTKLCEKFDIKNLGILIVDSSCQPGRRGVVGICIAYSGFIGVEDQRGKADLFGRELQITQVAKADAIGTAANLVMGEAAEATPFAVVTNAPVQFRSEQVDSIAEQYIPFDECLFRPLFKDL